MEKKLYITLLLLLSFSVGVFAQQTVKITGNVKDTEGQPLIGVNVTVKDRLGVGTNTDVKGNFTINLIPYSTLIITYLGYKKQEVNIEDKKVLNFILETDNNVLDEVVITAAGVQKKITSTGAITTVDVKTLRSPSANISSSLIGNVAGIIGIQKSGEPGTENSEFWIRGISTFGANQSALILVDGFERSLNEINSEDIEAFAVLKDASATAIYGSKGANGVVLITTRRGDVGKTKINVKAEYIYSTRTRTPEFVDGNVYAQLVNEALETRNKEPLYSNTELDLIKYGLDPDLYPNVDWMDLLLRKGTSAMRASINLQGGGTVARYFFSGSYVDEGGMYKTDKAMSDYSTNANLKRWNYRMNLDMNVTKTTLVSIGVSGYLQKQNTPGLNDALWNSIIGQNPISIPIMYSNGLFPSFGIGDRSNPWVLATQTGYNENWQNVTQTNLNLTQDFNFITKGLRFEARLGFDNENRNRISRIKWPEQYKAERKRDIAGKLMLNRISTERFLEQEASSSGTRFYNMEAEFHYNRQFKDAHRVGGMVKYIMNEKATTIDLGNDIIKGIPRRNQGVSGRFNYGYKDRYLAEFNFGYTGSETFKKGNQFGFFPAFSGAWNIGEERFIKKNLPWLAMAKIRYSYGEVGNDQIQTRFPYLTEIGDTGSYNFADINQAYNRVGLHLSRVASDDLSWEVAKKHDMGVDLSMFGNRINITVDIFKDTREKIYMQRKFMPGMVGIISQPWANVGKMETKGFDGNFSLRQDIGKVKLTLRGNMTYYRNLLIENDEQSNILQYQMDEGYRFRQVKGLIALGLFKDFEDIRNSPKQNFGEYLPGDVKYKDVNGDGIITPLDEVAIGSTNVPNLIYGLGLSVTYKGFDVNIHFQGAGKSSKFINGSSVYPFIDGEWGNIFSEVADPSQRWISSKISGDPATERTDAKYPRLSYGGNANNYRKSTLWLRDGRYLRLKTIEIGYSIPKRMLNKIGMTGARVFFIGNNVAVWDKLGLWDPELDTSNGQRYPLPKSFTLGITLNL